MGEGAKGAIPPQTKNSCGLLENRTRRFSVTLFFWQKCTISNAGTVI